MKDLLNRIVFHPDHGYGMIISDCLEEFNKIRVRHEDGFVTDYSSNEFSLVILPRYGEKIKVWDDEDVGWLEEYKGYFPKWGSPIQTSNGGYKHFAFIDESEESNPCEYKPMPGTNLADVCKTVYSMCFKKKKDIHFNFNGVDIIFKYNEED